MAICLMSVRKRGDTQLQMGYACGAGLINHHLPSQSRLIHIVCLCVSGAFCQVSEQKQLENQCELLVPACTNISLYMCSIRHTAYPALEVSR